MSEIKKICKDISERYVKNNALTRDDKRHYYLLGAELMKALNFSDNPISIQELDLLLDVAMKASRKEKHTSKHLEKEILKSIAWFVDDKVNVLLGRSEEKSKLTKDIVERELVEENKMDLEISLRLMNFGKELLSIVKSRDSFSGTRKGYATKILCLLQKKYEVEGLEDLFISNLKLKGVDVIGETLSGIQEYYKETEGERLGEIIALIKKKADKAKGRSELVGYLQTLIELGEIGDFVRLNVFFNSTTLKTNHDKIPQRKREGRKVQ